jgi:integrase
MTMTERADVAETRQRPKSFTEASVRSKKAEAQRRAIPDGGCAGLYLIVQPSGAKSWAVLFRSPVQRNDKGQGVSRKLTLGPVAIGTAPETARIGYPLSIAQARKLATDVLERVRRGEDPTHTRREAKIQERHKAAEGDGTFDSAVVEFLTRYKGRKRQGLRESTRLLTASYFGLRPDPDEPGAWKKTGAGVLKHWSGRSLSEITKRDAIVLLDKLVDAGHGVTANRTLMVLKTFFTWAMKRDLLAASPVAVLDPPAEEKSRERILSDSELAALWRVADAEGYPFGRLIQLLMLTGARRDELREAPWSEFDLEGTAITLANGTKWNGPLWALPAGRSKNGREHLVPLNSGAVEVLKKLLRTKGKLLFTTTGSTPISGLSKAKSRIDAAMLAELRKSDPEATLENWTPHDLRRTFYSGLQRLGFSIEVAEACVNHKGGTLSGVAKVYGRHQYLAEKTAAFEAWARHVSRLVNVDTDAVKA